MLVTLDLIVLSLCVVSLILTFKTLRRAYRLGKAMGQFYHNRLHLPLSWWERRSLFSLWHYFNITSDLLILAGTLYKILLEFDVCLDIVRNIKHLLTLVHIAGGSGCQCGSHSTGLSTALPGWGHPQVHQLLQTIQCEYVLNNL